MLKGVRGVTTRAALIALAFATMILGILSDILLISQSPSFHFLLYET